MTKTINPLKVGIGLTIALECALIAGLEIALSNLGFSTANRVGIASALTVITLIPNLFLLDGLRQSSTILPVLSQDASTQTVKIPKPILHRVTFVERVSADTPTSERVFTGQNL